MNTQGSVRFSNNQPAVGYTVQVWDSDFGSDQLVGQTVTDVNGNYNINHPQQTDPWWTGGGGRGDFYVKVLSPGKQRLFQSPVHNNYSSTTLTVNAVVDPFVQNNWNLSSVSVPGMQAVWGTGATNVFLAGGTYLPFGVRDTRKILKLSGTGWSVVMSGPENLIYHGISGRDNNVFAVGEGYWSYNLSYSAIYKSSDNGLSWTAVQNPPRGSFADVFTPDGTLVLAVGTPGLILRSTDAGVTWTQISTPLASAQYYGVWGTSAANIFVVGWTSGGGVILRSTNGGTSWTTVTTGIAAASYNAVRGAGASNVFIVGSAGTIIQTADGGATWTQHQLGVPSAPLSLSGVWASSPQDVYVVGYFWNGYYSFGVIFHFNGNQWTDHSGYVWSPPRGFSLVPVLVDVWATADGKNVFAIGPDGLARRSI